MPLIKWIDEIFTVNIKKIDEQHKGLIDIINNLHQAMKEHNTEEKLKPIIYKLFQYTKSHFSTEEGYMKQYEYPGYEQHKKEHEMFVDKVNQFIRDYENKKIMLSIDIINFLNDWIVHHIKVVDKKYSSFFNDHGLK